MSTAVDELFDAALAMPENQRAELIEVLVASLQPNDRPPFDESWRTVIERRSAELESGIVSPIRWDDVKRKAREPKIG